MELSNLTVLLYANEHSVMVEEDPTRVRGLTLDLTENTWSYDSAQRIKIGKSSIRRNPESREIVREGVIGVYNRSIDRHMANMRSDCKAATQ